MFPGNLGRISLDIFGIGNNLFKSPGNSDYIYIYIPSGPQVSARGGVGWGMLTSCSWYVDGRGGVGHVNVMFMVR